ncbi:MAG: hypothetical protein NTU44_13490 [Bacteroidetes bacterium]|nr:hypothetical protein [Bacteroidota bacterium]
MKKALLNWKTTTAGGVIVVASVLVALGKVSMTELTGFMDSMKTFIPIVSGFILAFFAHDPQA